MPSLLGWRRNVRERRWQNHLNGHDFVTTQCEPNKPVEITCRRCGYVHLDVFPGNGPPYWPWYPVKTPCP